MPNLAVAVLAAGASARMGKSKLLLERDGRTLLDVALYNASNVDACIVLLVVNCSTSLGSLSSLSSFPGVTLLVNNRSTEGIASSIRLAVDHASNQVDVDRILFMNCDQPNLTPDSLKSLLAKQSGEKIVASEYNGVLGSPALFPRKYFSELSQLKGDMGAKVVLQKHSDDLVVFEHKQALFDVDTPEDYQSWLQTNK